MHDPNFFSTFEKVKTLASGSQGVTELFQDTEGNRICKKHILNANENSPGAKICKRNLDSPYLVHLQSHYIKDDNLYIIMEYCEGGSLHDFFVKRRRLSASDTWVILVQLLKGLEYLHNQGIIHRGLKPGNVLLCSHERPLQVKICDFGISHDVTEKTASTFIGTLGFMAPEVLASQSYGAYVDLWSLGVLLYFLAHNGTYPFENMVEILQGDIPVSNTEFGPIISRLLVRDPNQRATVAELLQTPKVVEVLHDFERDLAVINGNRNEISLLSNELQNSKIEAASLRTDLCFSNLLIAEQDSQITELHLIVEEQSVKL
ncbi:hypothetical protein RCL1_008378 [Eukaryota sp. TZLM3-RCL]